MAFEDSRSSPGAAVGACPNSPNVPTSPVAIRTFPYTCTTLTNPHHTAETKIFSAAEVAATTNTTATKTNFLRITTYALSTSSPKNTRISSPLTPIVDRHPQVAVKDERGSPTVAAAAPPKFCIDNILHADFGRTALLKTKDAAKITFKPYELNRSNRRKPVLVCDDDDVRDQSPPPLGSLCRTVSQIGKQSNVINTTGCINLLLNEPVVVNTRCKSPAAESSGSSVQGDIVGDGGCCTKMGEEGKVPTLWPAWVYCTRYSDRPSSG